MKIIDAHSHYMPPDVAENTMFFKRGWSDIDRQLTVMDQAGVERALLLYPTSDAHLNMGGWENVCRIYNAKIAEIIKKHPSRFMGAGILPPDGAAGLAEELKRFEDLNLSAVSLASSYDGKYLDDEKFLCVYEYAQKHNMPLHVHAQIMSPIGEDRVQDPLLTPVLEYLMDVSISVGKLMMNGVFQKYPGVKFIFAHYGGVLPLVKERFDTTYAMLRKREFVKDIEKFPSEYFKNLYFDTSGSKSFASLLCALEIVDASHLLFGSDFPANQDIAVSVSAIVNSALAEGQKKQILSGNATDLFDNKIYSSS